MTEEKQKIRTWKVEAPIGLDIVTANLMNEAELRQFAKNLVKEPKTEEYAAWMEKIEKDSVEQVVEYLVGLDYKVKESK